MDLDFGSTEAEVSTGELADERTRRWTLRGDELLARLALHGAANAEYRADLREGRFVWLHPDGRVMASARAEVLCRYARSTSVLTVEWRATDPQSARVARVASSRHEHDDVSEDDAWNMAMDTADAAGTEYLYRVATPQEHYFLGLRELSFEPSATRFVPAAPTRFVLTQLEDLQGAVTARAEPADVLGERVRALGATLKELAARSYSGTDWVAVLDRTGARLERLAKRVPRGSFASVLLGHSAAWLEPEAARELGESIDRLRDEWRLYS